MWDSLAEVVASVLLGWVVMAIFLVRTERERGMRILLERWLFLLVFGAAFGLGLGSVWVVVLAFTLPLFEPLAAAFGNMTRFVGCAATGAALGLLGAGLFRLVPIAEGPLSGVRPSLLVWTLLGLVLGGLWYGAALLVEPLIPG